MGASLRKSRPGRTQARPRPAEQGGEAELPAVQDGSGSLGGGEQQEVVYDRVEREEAVKIDSFHVEIIHLAGLRRLSFTSCRRMWVK